MDVVFYVGGFVAAIIALLVGGYYCLYLSREFWKIKERDQMVVDGKTSESVRLQADREKVRLDSFAAAEADADEKIRRSKVAQEFLEQHPKLEAERNALESALEMLGEQIRVKSEENAGLMAQRNELSKEIVACEGEKARLAQDIEVLKKEINDFPERKKKLEDDINVLQGKHKEAQEAVDALNSQKGLLENSARVLEAKIADLTEQKSKKEEEVKTQQSKIDEMTKEAKELDKSINEKLREIGDLDAKRKERDALNDAIKGLRATLENMSASAKGEVVLRQVAFNSLQQDPPFKQPRQVAEFSNESNALSSLKNYVRNTRKFDVPDRLLYAFHTALKTSDISCLTVMAGVSGTGKSALPNMYAKAMGIHFVSLAVEPRWDSPKDLLGFFNYVTNRYESTPLARALFQFAGHNEQGGLIPDVNLSDYMLMVMLDEMNLARIEYYFSEFLSKLEMRRSGNLKNADHMRKISMELFAGFLGNVKEGDELRKIDEKPIRLYADYNTLFVGTMNEDETTQSLSDKVIDRANVLHFGKPAELRPNVGNGNLQDGDVPMLKRSMWESWKKEVEHDDVATGKLKESASILNELNGQLALLGRPFAHRTYQAMLTYLKNYPFAAANKDFQSAVAYSLPVADQIAMRVMPKLRGLDLTMHSATLSSIQSVLTGRVKDETLNHAFAEAIDLHKNRSGFFQWQGIDWANE
jgi:predicted  nucleic acid-binding Zn-ribbon protein